MVTRMTEPQKRNRHPKYKTPFRVNNWREYEQSLRARGDITLWISQEAIDAWTPAQTGKRGAQPVYSDLAIETALALRLLFHLPLRQTEGFLGSVLRLMGLSLPCPDHTTLSRRNATVTIRRQVDGAPQGPVSVIVDSTGLRPQARVMLLNNDADGRWINGDLGLTETLPDSDHPDRAVTVQLDRGERVDVMR
jgi:hypothetical protein